MADKSINELARAETVELNDLFVLQQSGQAKSMTGQVLINNLAEALDGHGGIADISYSAPTGTSLTGTLSITMADGATYTVEVHDGNGIKTITVSYGVASSGTNPATVSNWTAVPVAPTEATPYQWTRLQFTDKTNSVTTAYTVTRKAQDPSITIGSVTANSAQIAGASVQNSGTLTDPVFDFEFDLPQGEKGDTGDYLELVATYGTSTAASTQPSTWYSSPTSLSYAAGNFIWRRTQYVLHEQQTVQAESTEVIGYIGANGAGSGTVTQITFNGTTFADDGTGNVGMTIDPEDVGAVADPENKANGQVLTYDSAAGKWVAATPSVGNVNTVNNVGVTAGTTNIQLYATAIPVSSSDNTSVANAIPQASNSTPLADATGGAVGTGTTWARADHKHPLNVDAVDPSDLGTASPGSATTYARRDHVHDLPSFATTVTLATSWTQYTGYSTQTITISGVTANSKVDLQTDAATINSLSASGTKVLYIENNAGVLTAYAIGKAPTSALTLSCIVTEVRT